MNTVIIDYSEYGYDEPKQVTLRTGQIIDERTIVSELQKQIEELKDKREEVVLQWLAVQHLKVTIFGQDVVVGRSCFSRCMHLEELVIVSNSCAIERWAFARGTKQFPLPVGLKKVLLYADDVAIEACAFRNNRHLTNVVLPMGTYSIGDSAFSHCEKLRSITLPPSIKTIGDDVFDESPVTLLVDTHWAETFGSFLSCYPHETVPMDADGARALVLSRSADTHSRSEVEQIAASAPIAEFSTLEAVDVSNTESLLRYLEAVSNIETQVYQLSEELADCLGRRKNIDSAKLKALEFESISRMIAEDGNETKRKLFEKERQAITEGLRLSSEDKRWIGAQPSDPNDITGPVMPSRPLLEEPGLFNKKRVEKRNAELEKEYQEAMVRYERAMAALQQRIAQYETDLQAWQQRRDTVIRAQLAKLEPFEDEVSPTKKSEPSASEMLEVAEIANDAMCGELRNRLLEAAGLLKAVYKANVIFPKYRNLAAVSTMFEYFQTGRCSSLQGPDGAYNLYESEVRQNGIIAKLDVVSAKLDTISDKLDRIQQNQYALYMAVEGANRRLNAVSQTLSEVLDVARNTNDTVHEVSAKASAIVANSANTAYWARKSAELTDSLGYLVAFKA